MRGSPPESFRSWCRYSTPAFTLSFVDAGSSGPCARLRWIQLQVPGITCMTPRAFALDTMPLLKPLSCQPIADASDGGTPCASAIWLMFDDVVRVAVGYGVVLGTTCGRGATPPTGVCTAVRVTASRFASADPVGSLSGEPARSGLLGSSPFIHATCDMRTPLRAAIALSVSPRRTMYAPCGG